MGEHLNRLSLLQKIRLSFWSALEDLFDGLPINHPIRQFIYRRLGSMCNNDMTVRQMDEFLGPEEEEEETHE